MSRDSRFPLDVVILSVLLCIAVFYALRCQEELTQLRASSYRLEKEGRESIEVYRGEELLREYEPRDGDVYRELLEIMGDPGE